MLKRTENCGGKPAKTKLAYVDMKKLIRNPGNEKEMI